jgi:predicted enzyme related to lactoylglutathione lyase
MSTQGQFVWYELMTTDPDAAQAFYSDVVGWTAADSGMPDMSYTLFKAGDQEVAGLMELPQEAREAGGRPFWLGYVAVDDTDASAEKVKETGGTIHRMPADIPGVGRFALVADPQGAVFALFTGAEECESAPPRDTLGHGGWSELLATDWESAFDYYANLFPWTKGDAIDMGPKGVYQLFAQGDDAIGGMMTKPEQVPVPFWLYYFIVDGIDAAKGRVEAANGQVLIDPMEVPGGGWIVQCIDPQGAMFALYAQQR